MESAREHCGHGRGVKDDAASRDDASAEERASARVVLGRDIVAMESLSNCCDGARCR